jgi:2-polyprenyl-3-methyl-5-hydroxy-6-metoxy-1,4-benzoquinol methylase
MGQNEESDGIEAARAYWDAEAARFDDEADHGLRDPVVREAWRALLGRWLPRAPAAVLDVGCGTGSLSVLMAEMGYEVLGIDFSPQMVARADEKARAAGVMVPFKVVDASNPSPQLSRKFDAVLCRHLLWALHEPHAVLRRWADLLVTDGRLALIEGFWHTGGGLRLRDVLAALPSSLGHVAHEDLTEHTPLWGKAVDDERYIVVARR